MTTQPPAAESVSLSDAALGVGVHGEPLLPCPHCGHTDFDDWPIMEASGDEQQYIRCVWCFAAAPKPKWNLRKRELDAGGGEYVLVPREATHEMEYALSRALDSGDYSIGECLSIAVQTGEKK